MNFIFSVDGQPPVVFDEHVTSGLLRMVFGNTDATAERMHKLMTIPGHTETYQFINGTRTVTVRAQCSHLQTRPVDGGNKCLDCGVIL